MERKLTSAPCRSVSRFSAGFVFIRSIENPTHINPVNVIRMRDLLYNSATVPNLLLMFFLDFHPPVKESCSKRLFFGASINKRTRFKE